MRDEWRVRRAPRVAAGILALTSLSLVACSTENSYWARIFLWRGARFSDFATKFPARLIPNGSVIYHFRPAPVTVPSHLSTVGHGQGGREATALLSDFLLSTGTTAFLILTHRSHESDCAPRRQHPRELGSVNRCRYASVAVATRLAYSASPGRDAMSSSACGVGPL
jgi:hypothetical protein